MSNNTLAAKRSHIRLQLVRPAFALDVELDLPGDGITVLFGTSGSGKTSLLRCVAGLEHTPGARVNIAGEIWQDDEAGIYLSTWQRPLGYVFQEASLFAHLNVRKNLQFGLKRSHAPTNATALDAAINLLGISGLLDRATGQLSGGERQRVAIARALATQPRMLLLDEPLASLDQARRQDILPWLERLRDELKIPMLYVTHSSDEVARLADTLVVLDAGKAKACGPVAEVLAATDATSVLGDDTGALLDATVAERDAQWHMARLAFTGGSLWLRDSGLALGRKVRVRVLARDVSIATQEPQLTSIQNLLPCVVQSIVADTHPSQALVRMACGDSVVLARIAARAVDALQLKTGMAVWAQVKSAALVE
ncbi:molybdenum ABC transporter ATP-binding protein [Rhodoferax sp. AJA081-3]|uniref:molybdenum ABC transporter ATP-binding protein n=1 Tax=Rhodoferax sp. AJA081-3 TaxID=2752316 RepID=UPI001ADEDAF8|nr:molybdenum ABC transporter ATP-binding protein [Rhodoferax sp. AJA081-3]QTN29871.1 molybdenum ABC transporter ATP-binding protein [Rhodoferax sp. AJA081-3]